MGQVTAIIFAIVITIIMPAIYWFGVIDSTKTLKKTGVWKPFVNMAWFVDIILIPFGIIAILSMWAYALQIPELVSWAGISVKLM